MKTSELLAKLKTLAGQAGQSIRERLGLVETILKDVEYVTATFGDESKALETLEADCFGDLCGARSLPELLTVYREFPDESDWKRNKWNLTRLLAEWDGRREKRAPSIDRKNPVAHAVHEELKQKFAESGMILQNVKHDFNVLQRELDKANSRIRELEREKLILATRVEELEKMFDKRFAMAG